MQTYKIEKIKPSSYRGVVNNIEVEEDNSYVTNGFIVHNCSPSVGLDIFFDRHALSKQITKEPIKVSSGFKIFYEYDPSHRYGGGQDIGGGVGLDHSTSVFIDFSTMPARVVATFKSNTIKPDIFGDEIERQALMFGEPIVAPENNKFDMCIGRLKQIYDNIYSTKTKESRIEEGKAVNYGWNTNQMTKPKMLFDFKKAVEDGFLELTDIDLVNETNSYTRDDLMDKEEDPRLTTRHFDLIIACFVKGTLILTDKGQRPIETICVGDRVMTRNGYRKVKKTLSHKKEVVTNIGLTGTYNHPVFYGDNKIKDLSGISRSDILYIWNKQKIERLSYTKAQHIIGTQMQNEEHTEHTILAVLNGKSLRNICIERFGRIVLEISQKVLLFTIKTATQAIIALRTLRCYLVQNIWNCICKNQKDSNNSEKHSERIETKSIEDCRNIIKTVFQLPLSVAYATSNLVQLPVMQSIALKYARKDITENKRRNQNKKRFVLSATGHLRQQYHIKKDVQKSVMDYEEGKNIQRVFNLEVEDTPEYFANNILVHNCAIAWQMKDYAEPIRNNEAEYRVQETRRERMTTNDSGL